MTTWINGRPGDCIDPGDRGLQFGDGLFETLRIDAGRPCFWPRHRQRLAAGCDRLGIDGLDWPLLERELHALAAEQPRAALKLIVTRGSSERGYRADAALAANRILRLAALPAPPPAPLRVRLCAWRLAVQPALAGIKHLNRLDQVMARREWDDPGIAEGLVLDRRGRLVEGTMSNLFLVRDGRLLTPDLSDCGVAGILRSVIIDRAAEEGIALSRQPLTLDDLAAADEVLLCNSLLGLCPVGRVEGIGEFRPGPVGRRLQQRLARQPTDDSSNWYSR